MTRFMSVHFDASASSRMPRPRSCVPAQAPDSPSTTLPCGVVSGDAQAAFSRDAAAATLPLTDSLLHRLREAGL